MTVFVCVGSSCHLKGSYEVIELLTKRVKEEHLENQIELKGTFCLGKCGVAGVSIKVEDEIITGVTTKNFDDVFNTHILSKIKG